MIKKLFIFIFLILTKSLSASTIIDVSFNGNATDSGPNGWNFTTVGTVPYIQAGVVGGFPSQGMAGQFSNGNYFTNANLTGYLTSTSSVLQLDFDVYAMANNGFPYIIGESGSNATQIGYLSGTGWTWKANGVSDNGSIVLTLNKWHHMTFVFGTSTKISYVDGVLDINTSHNGRFSGTTLVYGTAAAGSNWWTGYISNFIIMNSAQTPTVTPTQIAPPAFSNIGTPIVTPAYTWQAASISEPSVLNDVASSGVYRMIYLGNGGGGSIGEYTSPNPYLGPWTATSANQILGDGFGNTSHAVGRPTWLPKSGSTYRFIYCDFTTSNLQMATSTDGVTFAPVSWTVLSYTSIPNATSAQNNRVFQDSNGTWWMMVEYQIASGLFQTALFQGTSAAGDQYTYVTSPLPWMGLSGAGLTAIDTMGNLPQSATVGGYGMSTTSTSSCCPIDLFFFSGPGILSQSIWPTPVATYPGGNIGDGYDMTVGGQLYVYNSFSTVTDTNADIGVMLGPTPTPTITPTPGIVRNGFYRAGSGNRSLY